MIADGGEEGDLPRSLGCVVDVRSGRRDERSGRLRRVVQNMLMLLLLFWEVPVRACTEEEGVYMKLVKRCN